jgi:antitoxin component of RelBE/YafQ-DinJ toxin-antitoxin module
MGSNEDDDIDRAIMLFAKLIARQRELPARLSGDDARQDYQRIERELKEIDSAQTSSTHLSAKAKSSAQMMMGGARQLEI